MQWARLNDVLSLLASLQFAEASVLKRGIHEKDISAVNPLQNPVAIAAVQIGFIASSVGSKTNVDNFHDLSELDVILSHAVASSIACRHWESHSPLPETMKQSLHMLGLLSVTDLFANQDFVEGETDVEHVDLTVPPTYQRALGAKWAIITPADQKMVGRNMDAFVFKTIVNASKDNLHRGTPVNGAS